MACSAALAACSGDDYGRPPCRSDRGSLDLSVPISGCPQLSAFDILPTEVDVGSSVQLVGAAAAPLGDRVSFLWTATNGVVADPSAPITTFKCTEAGVARLQLTASNALVPDNGCSAFERGMVVCDVPMEGGAGGD
jgi:hypothetical protein